MKPAALAILAAGAAIGALSAQQSTFRTSVEAVRLDVSVTRGGRAVAGLTARDFTVLDNGLRQRVDAVTAVDALPLSVMMTLDTSSSVAGERLAHLVDAARGLLAALRPGDRAGLITFADRVQVRVPFTTDIARLDRAFDTVAADGPTAVYDAVWIALQQRVEEPSRPLVLVFSDGVDNTSWLSASEINAAARRADAVIHTVGLRAFQTTTRTEETAAAPSTGSRRAPPPRRSQFIVSQPSPASRFLEELALATGGRALSATSPRDLRALFTRALDEMRARYVVSYYPDRSTAGWHDVKVSVSGRADIVARPGYFVP